MASKAATHYLQFDIQWSSLALLFYDYALTFPSEVKYIWGSKMRLSTFLYIFCRYALVANVLYLLAIANQLKQGVRPNLLSPTQLLMYPSVLHDGSCDTWYKIIGALSVFGRAAVIVTFTSRTYAIYARNTYILVYLGLIGATCIALDIMHVPGLRFLDVRSSKRANLLLSILMVIFEYSSAILTITRSLMAFRVGGRKQHAKGLMNLIFEQGVLYFSIISLFTTAAVILNVEAPAGFFQRLLNAFTLPLSGLLTARFLLHIRAYEHARSLATQTQTGASRHHATGTLASFRAAAGGAMSSMVDQFGDDPVEAAQRQAQAEASGVTTMAAGSNSTDGPSEISLVRRKSGSIQDHSASTSAV
ncbi:hypothetical protein PTI98_012628 [Pleurotus ostreatus]|nr:hypothetical protein PTI98_012628 [Pleurotus ostreatus]